MTHFTQGQSRTGLIHGLQLLKRAAEAHIDTPFDASEYATFIQHQENGTQDHWTLRQEDHSIEARIANLNRINPKVDRIPYDFEDPLKGLISGMLDLTFKGVVTQGRELLVERRSSTKPDISEHMTFRSFGKTLVSATYDGLAYAEDHQSGEMLLPSDEQRAALFEAFGSLTVGQLVSTVGYIEQEPTSPLREL